MASDDLRRFVEGVLGYRIAKTRQKPTEYDEGFQVQWLGTKQAADGSGPVEVVTRVMPASPREYQLFELLCTPQERWGQD